MPATLRVLLGDDSFPLRVLTALDDDALDRPVSWVHSSDLIDPTPWLEPGNLLLTNGAQFSPEPDAAQATDYCRRLRAHGVVGLGFATDIIHDRVPLAVVRAGEAVDLPIVEIADRAPFIRIIRFVADIIAADRAARLSWLLDAQRAVARAAVRDDGLREILHTLSHLLGAWVELYDALGGRLSLPGLRSAPRGVEIEVGRDVRRLLERRTAASLVVPSAGHALLQTIGQSSRLRGVLAIGGAEPLDPAGKELVATVVALASIALEQQRGVQTALRSVRAGVVEMLLDGHVDAARRRGRLGGGRTPRRALSRRCPPRRERDARAARRARPRLERPATPVLSRTRRRRDRAGGRRRGRRPGRARRAPQPRRRNGPPRRG
jgi:purine catabolism regulator